jgi:hypothetical protein
MARSKKCEGRSGATRRDFLKASAVMTSAAVAGTLGFGLVGRPAGMAEVKGKWGKVVPIAEDNHPNLYYNQSEIDELRKMILVNKSPQELVDHYSTWCKGLQAVEIVHPWPRTHPERMYEGRKVMKHNIYAAISYMIEPTRAKAGKIKACIYGFMKEAPDGVNGDHGTGTIGLSTTWLFDLALAYHPDMFADSERSEIRNWFRKCAEAGRYLSTNRTANGSLYSTSSKGGSPPLAREGKTISLKPNWFSAAMLSGLCSALLSGDKAAVEFWADSGWPHDMLTSDGVTETWPPLTCNMYDLVMHIKAIFPSGANSDTYVRDSFRPSPRSVHCSYDSDKQSYHDAQAQYILWAAEAAYHNGMTRVFDISDDYSRYSVPSSVFPGGKPYPDNTPGLLRHHLFTVGLRGIHNRRTGNEHLMGWEQPTWMGYRRYDDAAVVDGAQTSYNIWGAKENVMWRNNHAVHMGFPRRVVYSST